MQSHLNTEYIIGTEREERLELPETVLREGLINALAHRDYRKSSNVQIYIFQDRVEIVNPGGLVGGLTMEDLGKRSAPRNPLLFGVLQRMGLVENIGSGLRRITEELEERNLQKPEFDVNDNWFSLILKRAGKISEKTSEKTSEKASEKSSQKIIKLMKAEPNVTIEELSLELQITTRSVERNIKSLQEKGVIRRVGPDRGGHWEVLK